MKRSLLMFVVFILSIYMLIGCGGGGGGGNEAPTSDTAYSEPINNPLSPINTNEKMAIVKGFVSIEEDLINNIIYQNKSNLVSNENILNNPRANTNINYENCKIYLQNYPSLKTLANSNGYFELKTNIIGNQPIIAEFKYNNLIYKWRTEVNINDYSLIEIPTITLKQASAKITGKILDSITQKPIENTTIIFWDKTSVSDNNGYYTLDNIPEGNWDISINHKNYQNENKKITILRNQTCVENINLTPITSSTSDQKDLNETIKNIKIDYDSDIFLASAATYIFENDINLEITVEHGDGNLNDSLLPIISIVASNSFKIGNHIASTQIENNKHIYSQKLSQTSQTSKNISKFNFVLPYKGTKFNFGETPDTYHVFAQINTNNNQTVSSNRITCKVRIADINYTASYNDIKTHLIGKWAIKEGISFESILLNALNVTHDPNNPETMKEVEKIDAFLEFDNGRYRVSSNLRYNNHHYLYEYYGSYTALENSKMILYRHIERLIKDNDIETYIYKRWKKDVDYKVKTIAFINENSLFIPPTYFCEKVNNEGNDAFRDFVDGKNLIDVTKEEIVGKTMQIIRTDMNWYESFDNGLTIRFFHKSNKPKELAFVFFSTDTDSTCGPNAYLAYNYILDYSKIFNINEKDYPVEKLPWNAVLDYTSISKSDYLIYTTAYGTSNLKKFSHNNETYIVKTIPNEPSRIYESLYKVIDEKELPDWFKTKE